MYEGNYHIFSAGIMRFDYEPSLGHPTLQLQVLTLRTRSDYDVRELKEITIHRRVCPHF